MFRKTEKELQTSYTLIYHHLTQTWNCSCETDIEVTKCDLEDVSDFKTEVFLYLIPHMGFVCQGEVN